MGIKHQFSTKYTPQLNGLVERKNRTLIDMARSMPSEYNVRYSFWAEAINMACYCSNQLYCHPLLNKTPYELLNGRKPNIAYFRVFGCKCYILKKGTRLSKFEKKCDEGFLLGYSSTSKAYRVWNKTHGIVEEVHDVEVDETNGSQDENENFDDVRGVQLANAMKNMDIGDIRPREVIDVEYDKNQVLPPPSMQNNCQASKSGSQDQVQIQQVQDQQVASSSQSNESNAQPSASDQAQVH